MGGAVRSTISTTALQPSSLLPTHPRLLCGTTSAVMGIATSPRGGTTSRASPPTSATYWVRAIPTHTHDTLALSDCNPFFHLSQPNPKSMATQSDALHVQLLLYYTLNS
jgi:hypothetical protein